MPWTPVGPQDKSLKNDIKAKVFSPALFKKDDSEDIKTAQVEYIYQLLLNASGCKQAVAILNAISSVDHIKKINEYGFNLIKDNSVATIQATIGLIPAVLVQRRQAQIAQDNINSHINTYLISISGKYKQHQAGTIDESGLPLKKDLDNDWAVFYNNGFNKLPFGKNIEWYPFIGSTKSIHKRFFTHRGNLQLWFADGGTHGNADDWWERTAQGDWKKM